MRWCVHGHDFISDELTKVDCNFLEIGVLDGEGLEFMAKNHPTKTIYGIDPFVDDAGDLSGYLDVETVPGQPLLEQKRRTYKNIQGLNNIVFSEMTSIEFNNQLTESTIANLNIGWILIDGSPYYHDLLNDLCMAVRLIGNKKGGIVLDDADRENAIKARKEFMTLHPNKVTKKFLLKEEYNIPGPFNKTYDEFTMVFRIN